MQRLTPTAGRYLQFSLILLICVAVPMLAGARTPQPGGDYRAPLSVEPITLDPAYYTDIYSMNVAANLFDGLLAFDESLNIKAAIARRWKISRDHRSYTFQLREGVRFHNGREVTAEDFVYSFQRILAPQTESPASSFFLKILGAEAFRSGASENVAGLIASGRYTLKITLKEPFAPFLPILAMVNAVVIPVEAADPEFSRNPVGTGPFRFTSWEAGEAISLRANDGYFGGRPYLDELRFSIYGGDNREQIYADFQRGLLDHARLPKTNNSLPRAANVISRPGLNVVYIGMNTRVAPFGDVRIRQALNYAVDSAAIVTGVTRRGAVPAAGLLPPGLPGYDPDLAGYPYDPERAAALLSDAGYPGGQGFPAVQLWTASKSDSVHQELTQYQRYFAALGLRVEVKAAESWRQFIDAIADKKAALFYAAWYADYPDADNFFFPLVHSQSKTNRMRFSDPQVDYLLSLARVETDYVKRAGYYKEVGQMVMRAAPTINQHYNSNNYLFGTWVNGAEIGPLGITYFPFRKVWIDQHERRQLSVAPVGADHTAGR